MEIWTPEEAGKIGYQRTGPDSESAVGLLQYIGMLESSGKRPPRVVVDNSDHPELLERAGGVQFTLWEKNT